MASEHITHGNIFDDLGLDRAEAENLKIRARLMYSITRFVRNHGLTQEDAAKHFGVSQSRISKLLAGKINDFTIDALINMHAAAGIPVTLEIGEVPA